MYILLCAADYRVAEIRRSVTYKGRRMSVIEPQANDGFQAA